MMKRIIIYFLSFKFVRNILIIMFQNKLWRTWEIGKYLKHTKEPKLQIGFGKNPLEGWLNTGISLKECYRGTYMDAGKPFPLPDNTFNFIYSEHLFEHLTYRQAQNMLKESYRVLKPGGIIRIATPDLQFLINLYNEPEKTLHKNYIEYSAKEDGLPATAVYIINRFHTTWGHQIIYDRATLIAALKDTGFKDITSCEMGQSTHVALKGVERHFKLLPYEYNLLETMIVEATK